MAKPAKAVVTVKCIECGQKREIKPDEIPKGQYPMCDRCFVPMIAVRAEVRR